MRAKQILRIVGCLYPGKAVVVGAVGATQPLGRLALGSGKVQVHASVREALELVGDAARPRDVSRIFCRIMPVSLDAGERYPRGRPFIAARARRLFSDRA